MREPLFHFVLLGTAVFAVDGLIAPEGDGRHVVVVDVTLRDRLAAELERRLGRPPDSAVLEDAVEGWIDEEILYREGLALGLDREDPLVRDRVIRNMTFFHEQAAAVAEPTDDELASWFEQHRDLYAMPERFDFVQVFAGASRLRAAELTAQLRAGDSPAGEPFRQGREFRRRSRGNVETLFGSAFAQRLSELRPGGWEIVQSTHGFHVVRLDARLGGEPQFEALRERVAADWQRERRRDHAREAARALRATYVIHREDP